MTLLQVRGDRDAAGNATERAEPLVLVWAHSLHWAWWMFGLRGWEELGEDWVRLSSWKGG